MTAAPIEASYRCSECGHGSGKWMGFCTQCRARGTLRPEQSSHPAPAAVVLSAARAEPVERLGTSIDELDRTLGGGLVPGAAVLLGGEPGIGKSTLLLQVATGIGHAGHDVLLALAEESPSQVALRASRLGTMSERVSVLATGDVEDIEHAFAATSPSLLVVDSIQAIGARDVEGAPGSQAQVRACGSRLVALAKQSGVPLVMIGHVTKEGTLAGPRVLEHLVDVVLYLEGDSHRGVRFVRGVKNRFGPTPALGLFEMGDAGLVELPDPSRALAPIRSRPRPGVVLFPAVEGRRPVVVEVQALVAPTRAVPPRRSVKGIEASRLHQVVAVLERHTLLPLSGDEIYVAAVGGVRLREPAADLAVALAVASSATGTPLPPTAAWGEVGLTGEIRGVGAGDLRRDEASRLGIDRFVAPGRDGLDVSAALSAAGIVL